MKSQFVESLQEGDQLNDYFVAIRKDLRTQQNGNKFLGMVFKDRTGEIGGIMWTDASKVSKLFEVGDVVKVRGLVNSYQSRLQIRVDQVLPLVDSEYDLADLTVMPEDMKDVLDQFTDILHTIQNPWLLKLTDAFLDDAAFMAAFRKAAAGKKWHHAFPGGLLVHCLEMARLADCLCGLYPNIDRDLLLTAILVHDAGKIEEMSHDLFVDYTDAGKLVGHLVIGCRMVEDRVRAIEGFPDTLNLQLQHCIVSHHGELVNGSPIVPKTVEAIALHHIDNLDAQVSAFTRVVQETRDRGESWSEYMAHIGRQIWTKS
jgi:3'-5' exoribonuclease